jgi:hypothetical protein
VQVSCNINPIIIKVLSIYKAALLPNMLARIICYYIKMKNLEGLSPRHLKIKTTAPYNRPISAEIRFHHSDAVLRNY